MDTPRTHRFLVVENDAKYATWLRHSVSAGWPAASVAAMDWKSFERVRAGTTVRDYDLVMLSLAFDETLEEITTDGFDWIRSLRSQPGFPEMIVLAEGGSEIAAIRTLRLGAADYLPKRLLTPARLQRSIRLTLRAIEKDAARRAARMAPVGEVATRAASPAPAPGAPAAVPVTSASPETAETRAISTQTGTGLQQAAVAAVELATVAAAPVVIPESVEPAAAQDPQPQTSGSPTPEAPTPDPVFDVPVKAESDRDPSSVSMPAIREPKPIAPDIHHIPGYTLLQKIGESEAAAVYLAISEDAGRNVALKVSKRRHTGDANDTGARAIMFQREFEAIAALDHPSIIDLYDYGIHEGVEYLAMEYFPCGDLKARLQNPLTADEAITFVREIAKSLKIVHDAGIIHRDLKPPNVMLRDDGSVVLIDFGLARSLMGGDSSTRTGVLRGSPYYMSPEQAQGETLDARTDLYSLGVILYEMLAGRKPYLGASAIDVLQQHVMAPVPELPMHHLAYQPLLDRLMAKSRDQRIASCDELLRTLDDMSQAMSGDVVDPKRLVSAGGGR